MGYLIRQLRLAASETLIRWAIAVSPPDCPETIELYRAVHWLFSQRIGR